MSDIAREAGVSVPTVSKVVKGRPDVGPATRARVLELVTKHGYTSRGSDTRLPTTIELSFDGFENVNNMQILRGILDATERFGIDVVVKTTPTRRSDTNWAARLSEAHHSGMILVTSRMTRSQQEHFAADGVPLVVIDPVNTPLHGIPSVGVNNFAGGRAATQHLVDLGHRKIAVVLGAPSECAAARLAGYHSVLREAGIEVRDDYIRPGEFRFIDGRIAGDSLMDLDDPPTAVFAMNDLEALGVLDAAHERGISVPEQLSVVGFDDSVQAISASPHLTTVRQPFAEIGATAAQLLLQVINGDQLTSGRLELAAELVVRDSTTSL